MVYLLRLKNKGMSKMDKTAVKENKMGTMDITRLLFSISVPMIISMLVQALYNIVDSVFVANFDNNAGTAALTIAFPIQNLMIALAAGLCVGMNALLSRSLGQKNFERANKIAGQGIFLTLCGYLIFLAIGLFAVPMYVRGQAGENELIYKYGVEYLSLICVGSLGVFVQITMERLLQATGKSFYSMMTQASGAIINIILDPIMIFGLLGFPKMGVFGAAVATVIGQWVAATLGIIFNLRLNKEIAFSFKNILPNPRFIKEILIIGVPSVLMQAIGSVMTFCMNNILLGFDNGVSAMNIFGIYFKLHSFVFMPVFGLNNGMIPIVAYNYGAGRKDRVMSVIKIAGISAVSYMLLGLLVFQTIPEVLLGFFNASADMLKIGRDALRIISLSFIFAGFAIITISVCQALGKSIYGLFTSIGRQLVVLIPTAYLLSLTGNLFAVWWAFPIAELMSLILSIIFMMRVMKNTLSKI